MKSILFLIPTLGGGGAERVLVNLVNNLDKEKYDVTVQTLFDGGVNKEQLHPDIKYISNYKKQFKGNSQIFKLFSPKFLYKKLIKKRYDIVIAYLEGVACRVVSGCPYADSKLIAWIHVEQQTRKNAAYSFRSIKEMNRCYNKFSKIICVAETVKIDFQKVVGTEKEPEVLYNTNETEIIRKKAREPLTESVFSDDINIISVGRLVPEKGFDRLINVHHRLLESGVKNHLYILGEGELKENLQKQVAALNVAETVHLLGFKENPYQYVGNADLFVCSSRREGFSTAVTEALVIGTPVVSTNCSGAYELLGKNNEYGVVVGQNENELYEAIYAMLKERKQLQAYKEKAKERGMYFSKEKTVLAVEKMLDVL